MHTPQSVPPFTQTLDLSNVEVYRRALLAEEARLRPWGEVLFCQRPREESEEHFLSRLSYQSALRSEDTAAGAAESALDPAALRPMLRGLTRRSRTILLLYYGGRTQGAIAQRYGLSQQRVAQIIQAALRHLQKRCSQKRYSPRNQSVPRTPPSG
jgi:RNA polymerase sigma factor (sigma-70 family)